MKPPWMVVTQAVRRGGGQDRANLELVRHLSGLGDRPVHVVTHQADPEISSCPTLVVHRVPLPLGSGFLGERALQVIASRILRSLPANTIVLGNGGNFPRAMASWAHCVHAAWVPRPLGAPPLVQVLLSLKKRDAIRREAAAYRHARIIIANSERTRRDLVERVGIDPAKIACIYFGTTAVEPTGRPPSMSRVLLFVGALGWDANKGLDLLLEAMAQPELAPFRLKVVGAGADRIWRDMAIQLGVSSRVEFLGWRPHLDDVMASADLLVSPVRYEAYGLAVQDAILAGLPPVVTASAGITERFPDEIAKLLVPPDTNAIGWARVIARCHRDLEALRIRTRRFGSDLRVRKWSDMAKEMLLAIEESAALASASSRKGAGGLRPAYSGATEDRLPATPKVLSKGRRRDTK